MFIVIAFLLTTFNSYAQLSYGDGSETCNWSSSTNMTQRIYNCESVTVSIGQTITFSGALDYIIIRSQGDVNILGTLNVSANGVTAGPGGTASGIVNNGGEGITGSNAVDGGGGGGSGARFGNVTLPTAGAIGTGTTPGAGANIPGAGYFPENNFQNSFTGGAGGGAGGTGFDSGLELGGQGGAGGGGLIIIAKGQVSVSGNIISNGGNGVNGEATGNGLAGGGGGAGGSGGAIYIIGAQVDITGLVTALGGTGGSGGSSVETGGDGGNGGSGRIRIDTTNSVYTGIATSPTAFQTNLPTIIDPLASTPGNLKSDIEYSCVYKEAPSFDFYLNFLMGLLLVGFLQIPKGLRYRQ